MKASTGRQVEQPDFTGADIALADRLRYQRAAVAAKAAAIKEK